MENDIYRQGTQLVDKSGTALAPDAMNQALASSGYNLDSFKVSPVINAADLGKTPPMPMPPKPAKTDYNSIITGAVSGAQAATAPAPQDTKTVATPYTEKSKGLYDRITSLMGLTQNREADTQKAQEAAGVFESEKRIRNYNSRLTAIANEAQAASLRADDRLAPTFAISGEQDAIDRSRAIKALTVSTALAAEQGFLDTAKSEAQRAVDLVYKPIDDELNYKLKQLELAKPFMDAEQKEQAEILRQQYETEKSDNDFLRTTKQSYIAAAIERKASPEIYDAIASATSLDELNVAAGSLPVDPSVALDNQYKQAQIRKLNQETAASGIPPVTNPEAGQYSQALAVILGSGKFTKDQKADVVQAINNGEDPFAVIKNQAKNIMGQTLATSLDKYETAKTQLESIDSLLKEYYAQGGKTNVFKGSIEKTINKLGEVTDPALVEIATNISGALQIYRNAVSGTAYSVQEGKDISSIFPGINKSEGLNNAIISGRMKAFDTTIDSQYRNTLGSAYDTLKNSASSSLNSTLTDDDAYDVYLQTTQGTPPAQAPESVTPPQVQSSAIENEIQSLKSRGTYNDGDIRHLLRKRGYSDQEVQGSSIGTMLGRAITSVSSLFKMGSFLK